MRRSLRPAVGRCQRRLPIDDRYPDVAERDPFIELRDALCNNESIIDSLRYLILEEGCGRAEIAREFKGEGKLSRLVRQACRSDKGFTMVVEVLESLWAEARGDADLHPWPEGRPQMNSAASLLCTFMARGRPTVTKF